MNLARLLRRIAVTVVGTVILAVGVVLLVAPGPGLLVILLALIVFGVEYEWARRLLVTVRDKARSAAEKAAASRVATARRIGVHPNTVANRIRACRELLGRDVGKDQVPLLVALTLAATLGPAVLRSQSDD